MGQNSNGQKKESRKKTAETYGRQKLEAYPNFNNKKGGDNEIRH